MRTYNRLIHSSQNGQAVSEFIVSLSVLVPLLLALASFSNLLSLSTDTMEAGRLAAWERTVYRPSNGFQVSNNFVRDRISDNIESIYLARPYSDYGPRESESDTSLPSIVNREANNGQPVSVSLPRREIDGTEMVNRRSRLANRLSSAMGDAAAMQSPAISIAIDKDYSLFRAVELKHYRKAENKRLESPRDSISGEDQFNLSSHSALIAGGWMPATSSDFEDSTESAVFHGRGFKNGEFKALGMFQSGHRTFRTNGFEEVELVTGVGGYTTTSGSQEAILPSDLLTTTEASTED